MGANYGRTMWPLAAVDRCNLVGFGFGCEFGGEFGYGDLDFETDTVIEEKIICTSEIGKTGWTRIHHRFLRSEIGFGFIGSIGVRRLQWGLNHGYGLTLPPDMQKKFNYVAMRVKWFYC